MLVLVGRVDILRKRRKKFSIEANSVFLCRKPCLGVFVKYYAAVTPSRKAVSTGVNVQEFLFIGGGGGVLHSVNNSAPPSPQDKRNCSQISASWPSRKSHMRQFLQNGLGGGYLVAVTGSVCQLRNDCYGVYVTLTGRLSHIELYS